eukprot:UN00782
MLLSSWIKENTAYLLNLVNPNKPTNVKVNCATPSPAVSLTSIEFSRAQKPFPLLALTRIFCRSIFLTFDFDIWGPTKSVL